MESKPDCQPGENASSVSILPQQSEEDTAPWFAARLFMSKPQLVMDYLDEQHLPYFIPMEYVDVEDKDHHIRQQLRPVVRNLVFIKKSQPEKKIQQLLTEAPFKSSVIRKSKDDSRYYEIPAKQMFEFQAMCNPEIAMRKFLSEEQAKLKPGTPVYVKYGPLKGLSGRLVRSNKKYFLLKEIPCMGVMLKVARWCCKPLQP
ncbi:transcription termination/antitermination factor NusG [Prevotella sp. BV3P1]|uniref:UpxY family transcription antiterminator n=1 Tax=Prevotellaceae TaxID=171552 RepID=UPI0003B8513F|nr:MULTISPECIES: UpxY family transcription antiterminator [Prevotellaceae]ERT56332.1 transcription termination/antitermination factor NusG [Prevotella sp. BV3P1]KGF42363.1 UpdY protein [Hoylesella buccalis DNF00985]